MSKQKPTTDDKTTSPIVKDSKSASVSKPEPKAKKESDKKAQETSKPGSTNNTLGENKKPEHKTAHLICYAIILLIFFGLVCAVTIIILLALREPEDNPQIDRVEYPDPVYSILTGEEISNASLNSSPTFCVQIPNGQDGARPQAGLNQAAVVFEAIAEAGITRFAAVFQNATTSAIGPIRSLRPYYLEWDLPFNCTIVHAGGSDEAVAELNQTGARDLNENYEYMWREQGYDRLWNNLFTSPTELLSYNTNRGWTSSSVKAFNRYTPEENELALAENFACPEDEVCDITPVSNIRINFSGVPAYNTIYQYDAENNRYLRSYANGEEHLTYTCPENLNQPNTSTDCGEPSQVAPRVVIAMFVQEGKMSDNYHEDIKTTGYGSAIIFQNGEVIEGTWQKPSINDQIVFRDNSDNIIKLAPGQVWIAAVPVFGGSVYWD